MTIAGKVESYDLTVARLIDTIQKAEIELETFTGGQVDSVIDRFTHPFFVRRAQDQVRRDEAAQQAAILDSLPQHVALLDADGFIISVNRAWAEFALANGLQPADVVGVSYLDVCDRSEGVSFEEAAAVAAGIRAVLARETESFKIDYPCHSATEQRWFMLTVTPLSLDAHGGAVLLHVNITDRIRAERALAELSVKKEHQERLLSTTLTAIADFAYLFDLSGRFLFVNGPLLKLWGIPLESAVGKNFFELSYPEELAAKLQRQIDEVIGTGSIIKDETPYVAPDGSAGVYEYIFSPVFALNGAVEFVAGTTRDVTERKRSAEALLFTNQKFQQLVDHITDVFWIRSADMSEIHYLSPAYEQIWGRSAENSQAHSEKWADYIFSEDRERVMASLLSLSGDAPSIDIEYRIVRPDGEIRWVRTRGFQVRDDEGVLIRNIGIVTDITEKQLFVQALRTSEREFRVLAEAVPQIVWMTRADGSNTYFNQRWMDYTGLTLDESLGDGWITPFHPEERERSWNAWQEATASVGVYSLESRLRRADGAYRWWLVRGEPLQDESGAIVKWFGTCTDIHDLKMAELEISRSNHDLQLHADALRTSETEQRKLAEALEMERSRLVAAQKVAKVGSWETNLQTMEVQWSAETHRIFETGHATPPTHQSFLERVHPEDREIVDDAFRQSATDRMPRSIEHRLVMPDGRIKFVEERWQIWGDSDRCLVTAVGTCQDITERKQAEAALRSAQKLQAVGQLAAGVAHEFNNVLQTLMSMARITRLHSVDSEVLKIAEQMDAQIRRGAGVTRQLLLSSQEQELAKTTLDLCEEVNKASDLLRRLIPENIAIHVESSSGTAFVEGDAGQVQQVLLNLAINARDAMPDGGVLTLRVATASGEVSVDVEDTGVGFDDATREHLFEPFFTTKDVGKGTGLGLAVVYGIIEQHGGRVEVRSTLGEGSTFRIVLPESSAAELQVETSPSPVPNNATGRLLLVEDEQEVRDGVTMLLEMIGYEVIAVGRGEEAIALPTVPVPDLLLTDVSLPGMGGPAIAGILKARWPDLGVVLMTGYIDTRTRDLAREHAWSLLAKPFELEELSALLAETFRHAPKRKDALE